MFIATAVVTGLFAAVLLFSALGKLRKDAGQLATMKTIGFPEDKLWLLATAEIAAAVGLVVGLFWWPLGVAAAIGIILYFLGAVGAHLRAKDMNFAPAAVLLLIGVAALVLRLATV